MNLLQCSLIYWRLSGWFNIPLLLFFFNFPFVRAAWLVRRSFIWTCRGSVIIVISSIWCFFFSLWPPFPQLNADSMWCSLPGKKRTLKELKTKQNYNLNLTFTSSCFFFFFLLSWCINKRRAIGILKKKKTNDLSETRMHDTNKQTLLQQLDISVAYMCDFLHCVAKGFPQKVIIGVFFFSFVSRLDHRHQGSQVGLSAGVLHAAATITNEQITNSQTNDKKKNKQTNKKHASTRK